MTALYARQSVNKQDSISVQSQIDMCKAKCFDEYKIYTDRGFSGKSTDRPAFRQMINDIQDGIIDKIIIYKLDRLSRSLLDFLQLLNKFDKLGVSVRSCCEEFDTSTPQGRMMLAILMSFAQMERETIAGRVRDNYYARACKGMYLSGPPPLGYKKVPAIINGVNSSRLEEDESKSNIVKDIYNMYCSGMGLQKTADCLNNSGTRTSKGKTWTASTVSAILVNPAYVKADSDVYTYLLEKGAEITDSMDKFTGKNGCYSYGSSERRKGTKNRSFDGQFITVGQHNGIIDASVWLEVQKRINKNKYMNNSGSGISSWLCGLVYCKCGQKMQIKYTINKYQTKYYYLYCKKSKFDICIYNKKAIRVDMIEKIAERIILSELNRLMQIPVTRDDENEIEKCRIKISAINEKINKLLDCLAEKSEINKCILSKIETLDKEKENINLIIKEKVNNTDNCCIDMISFWKNANTHAKKSISHSIIEKIILYYNNMEIYLK